VLTKPQRILLTQRNLKAQMVYTKRKKILHQPADYQSRSMKVKQQTEKHRLYAVILVTSLDISDINCMQT